jgi:hypothetical protein
MKTWETNLTTEQYIECSAMSMKYLGETFDIHSGDGPYLASRMKLPRRRCRIDRLRYLHLNSSLKAKMSSPGIFILAAARAGRPEVIRCSALVSYRAAEFQQRPAAGAGSLQRLEDFALAMKSARMLRTGEFF